MSPAKREGFTVRVLRTGGTGPAGVGIVVSDRHIVTCAHVVNGAIGGRVPASAGKAWTRGPNPG